jgi:hypothetical protein
VHIAMLEDDGDPASHGSAWLNPTYVRQQLQSLEPYYRWQVAQSTVDPIDAAAQRAFHIFTGVLPQDDCWNSFDYTFIELFCFFNANRSTYIPAYGPNDHVVPVFAFNTTDDNWLSLGFAGMADDNWVDGTPSYAYVLNSPAVRAVGAGFSTVTVHEVGHHIGLSHPHDGYDAELGIDFSPADDFNFVWSGDESQTMMSYLLVQTKFGQFDRDNIYRWEMAGYLNWAASLQPNILASPNARQAQELLQAADSARERAIRAFKDWNYLEAARSARQTYELTATAAEQLGVSTASPFAQLQTVPSMAAPPLHKGDPIRLPGN